MVPGSTGQSTGVGPRLNLPSTLASTLEDIIFTIASQCYVQQHTHCQCLINVCGMAVSSSWLFFPPGYSFYSSPHPQKISISIGHMCSSAYLRDVEFCCWQLPIEKLNEFIKMVGSAWRHIGACLDCTRTSNHANFPRTWPPVTEPWKMAATWTGLQAEVGRGDRVGKTETGKRHSWTNRAPKTEQ